MIEDIIFSVLFSLMVISLFDVKKKYNIRTQRLSSQPQRHVFAPEEQRARKKEITAYRGRVTWKMKPGKR